MPMPAITLEETQKKFPLGCKVKITEKVPPDAEEPHPGWGAAMTSTCLGKIGVVRNHPSAGILSVVVEGSERAWNYRWTWVAPYEEKYDPQAQLAAAKKRLDDNLRSVFGY